MKTSKDLTWYFRAICLPAVVITAVALFYLYQQEKRDRVQAQDLRESHLERLAADLQEPIREAVSTNRISVLQNWQGPKGLHAKRGRFAWELHKGLVWSETLSADLAQRLNALSRWNEWTALGKKNAKRGLMQVPPNAYLLWARVGSLSYGVVFDENPLDEPGHLPNWPLGVILAGLLLGVLIPGGWFLTQTARKAREEDAQKTTFVSNVSHELKTPLAAISLWADLLAKGRLKTDERRQHAYEVIVGENARMIRLVENLLDFTRLEQKRRVYHPQKVDLVMLAREVVELVQSNFPNGVSLSGIAACEIETDADAVKQILINLLGNAAKYAAAGGPVEVVVGRNESSSSVAVADRGPGISAEDRKRIFDRFFRADTALENTTPGLGLGLSISKALAQDLKGDLSVSDRPGGGCVFTFNLPNSSPAVRG